MVKKYLIQLTGQQPLLLNNRVNVNDNVLRSQDLISGSSLRGAFASEWLRQGNAQEPWFQKVFVEEQVRFLPLYPVMSAPFSDTTQWVWGPIPETAQSCKRFKGFSDSHLSDKHGVVDHLFRFKENQEDYRHHFDHCQKSVRLPPQQEVICSAALQGLSGYMQYDRQQCLEAKTITPVRRLISRSSVNSMTDSVQGGQLFSLEPLDEGTSFWGWISVPETLDIAPLQTITQLRVGASLTRGMGKVEARWIGESSPLIGGSLSERLLKLQTLAKNVGLPLGTDEYWVTFDLFSPLILRDVWMRDRMELQQEDLFPYAPEVQWTPISSLVRSCRISGWNGLLQIPRSERYALAAGSVLLWKAKGSLSNILQGLEKIERYGLGERLGEGYGQIIPCHPFHLDFFPLKLELNHE
ncbi:type III-B CRISPR module-associated Cmr3 family protein [Deltaproteobacteria bacterium TL4]